VVGIVPLNEKNFATWRIQVKMALMRDDLWGYVSGTEAVPPADQAEAARRFKTRRDRALATMVMAIQPTLLYLVGDPTDPKEVYDKLTNTFQKKTWSNKLRLKKKLYSMKLSEGQSVHQLLKNFIELFDELAIIGEALDDEDKVIHLLASLPNDYNIIVTAMEAQDNIPSWEIVQEKLLHEELKHVSNQTCENTEKAFAGRTQFTWKNIKCFECGKIGHIKKNCRVFLKKINEYKASDKLNTAEVGTIEYDSCGLVHVLSAVETKQDAWIVDSGASRHMCNSRNYFDDISDLQNPVEIKVGDGRIIKASSIGTVMLKVNLSFDNINMKLINVLFVPKLAYNLVSVSQLSKEGKRINFCNKMCEILSSSDEILAIGNKIGDLYQLDSINIKSLYCVNSKTDCVEDLWHKRFCHINGEGLRKLIREKLVDGIDINNFNKISFCEPCAHGKNHRLPFPKKSLSRATEPLELIHSSVCKVSSPSLSGSNYFVTFTDDCTRYVWVYMIKTRDEVFVKFKEWKLLLEKQTDKKVKVLRSDNGEEFTSNEFQRYLRAVGVKHKTAIPKTTEQNDVSERLNRSLVEAVRTMLHDADLPKKFWAEALSTAVYVRNRSPTSALKCKTPYEAFYLTKPNVKYFRTFGCVAYAHVPKDERRKLDSKSTKSMFLGYCSKQKGYRLYDFNKMKVFLSRDVIFDEKNNITSQKETGIQASETYIELPIEEVTGDTPDIVPQQRRVRNKQRPVRNRRVPDRYGECTMVADITDNPPKVEDAVRGDEAEVWKQSVITEIQSMKDYQVWKLAELLKGSNVIKSKWPVYQEKLEAGGTVLKHKARLKKQHHTD
jgi:DNA-directed RNA polymerase subunit N (RpoN/RPB10)